MKIKHTKQYLLENSTILNTLLLNLNATFTKQELMTISGKNERDVRAEMEQIANYYPVRASAGRKGYDIIGFDSFTKLEELKKVKDEAFDQIRELENRISSLKARLKPLIALTKVVGLKVQEAEPQVEDLF